LPSAADRHSGRERWPLLATKPWSGRAEAAGHRSCVPVADFACRWHGRHVPVL